jgi:hypothetical protein
MYLFSRQARLSSTDAVTWAATIGKQPAAVAKNDVEAWRRSSVVKSPLVLVARTRR